ncbi:hypothetical protein F4703DRAFT_1728839, partial [Phycomyces blakesleeanus]
KKEINKGRKRAATKINKEDPETNDEPADNKPAPKGTNTAHFVKFMNGNFGKLDCDEVFKGNYTVTDNYFIHNSNLMLQMRVFVSLLA